MAGIDPSDIAHTIQIAIAPVFMLAGIGSLLNVVVHRLGRVVDRARVIEMDLADLPAVEHDRAVIELRVLDRRMTLANWSVFLCTSSACAICMVIAALFVAQLSGFGYARTTAFAFIFAMSLLIAGLILFLLEVRVALLSVRVRTELLERPRRRAWRR